MSAPKFFLTDGCIYMKIVDVDKATGEITLSPGIELLTCEWEEVMRLVMEISKEGRPLMSRYEVRPGSEPYHPYEVWDTVLNFRVSTSQTMEAAEKYAAILNEKEKEGDQQ